MPNKILFFIFFVIVSCFAKANSSYVFEHDSIKIIINTNEKYLWDVMRIVRVEEDSRFYRVHFASPVNVTVVFFTWQHPDYDVNAYLLMAIAWKSLLSEMVLYPNVFAAKIALEDEDILSDFPVTKENTPETTYQDNNMIYSSLSFSCKTYHCFKLIEKDQPIGWIRGMNLPFMDVTRNSQPEVVGVNGVVKMVSDIKKLKSKRKKDNEYGCLYCETNKKFFWESNFVEHLTKKHHRCAYD